MGATLPEEDITKAAPTSKSLAAHPSKKFVLVRGRSVQSMSHPEGQTDLGGWGFPSAELLQELQGLQDQ